MNTLKLIRMSLAAAGLALALAPQPLFAQTNSGPGLSGMRIDPEQIRQLLQNPQQLQETIQKFTMDNLRKQLAVTDDAEWSVIEERLAKVVRMRAETMFGAGMGLMGGMGRGGTERNGRGFAALQNLGLSDPNLESLQKLNERDASETEVKAGLEKLRAGRREKQVQLAKAQEDLRAVLTVRQEAVLVLAGTLE